MTISISNINKLAVVLHPGLHLIYGSSCKPCRGADGKMNAVCIQISVMKVGKLGYHCKAPSKGHCVIVPTHALLKSGKKA